MDSVRLGQAWTTKACHIMDTLQSAHREALCTLWHNVKQEPAVLASRGAVSGIMPSIDVTTLTF